MYKVRDTRTLKGFLLSFLLHLFIFLLFFLSFDDIKLLPPASSKQEKKITLNLSQFTPPAPRPKPRPKITPPQQKPIAQTPPEPLEKPLDKPKLKPEPPKPVAEKKVVKKEKGLKVAQKSEKDNNVTKIVKKEKKQKLVKAKPKKRVKKKKKKIAKKKPLPKTFRLPKKHTKDKLANALLGGRGKTKYATSVKPTPLIRRLYGKEFYSFTPTQQKFIKDHLSEIHRITQNTLTINGYPDVAVRTGQQGVNVVSFYLHPNGDISRLRLVKRMGYEALDNNTIAVIQIAYKDYPRPKTKTKIVFYVNYRLY